MSCPNHPNRPVCTHSEKLGKFLADRFVTGTCPKCRYEDARGDQVRGPQECCGSCQLTLQRPCVCHLR